MHCIEKDVKFQFPLTKEFDFNILEKQVESINSKECLLRFNINKFDENHIHANCLIGKNFKHYPKSIFSFRKRILVNEKDFNVCFIIPTGIGCEIGGHAGDSTPTLNMIASICDKVILHPNVVNASDINEMPSNSLYVEGSHLTKLLMGTIGLSEVKSNRLLVIIDDDKQNSQRFQKLAINCVNGAVATLGINADFICMDTPIKMKGDLIENLAVGKIEDLHNVFDIIDSNFKFVQPNYQMFLEKKYDAIAISSKIEISKELHIQYNKNGSEMTNPWGAVEAMLTHSISSIFGIPSAHAPMIDDEELSDMDFGIVDPRIAPEIISNTFLYCVLKGLHRSPKIIDHEPYLDHPNIFSVNDISAIIIPDGVLGLPVLAALKQGIKVIAVKNKNAMNNDLNKLPWDKNQFYQCDNYLEACGVLSCLKNGINVRSVNRPIT